MFGSMEQLKGLANSSVLVWNVRSISRCSNGGVAHWLTGLYFLYWGLRDSALGWYRIRRLCRSLRKSEPGVRRECETCSHAYLWGVTSVGEVADPLGLWTPIMPIPKLFYEDEAGTRET